MPYLSERCASSSAFCNDASPDGACSFWLRTSFSAVFCDQITMCGAAEVFDSRFQLKRAGIFFASPLSHSVWDLPSSNRMHAVERVYSNSKCFKSCTRQLTCRPALPDSSLNRSALMEESKGKSCVINPVPPLFHQIKYSLNLYKVTQRERNAHVC